MKDKTIIIVTGPTATGKTSLGIKLANMFNGEIISADSMQIYKEMNIGTAKPTKEEQSAVKHHLIDFIDPKDEYSVQEYVKSADSIIENLFKNNKMPIIVGGTGLYIKSLIYPYSFCNAPKNEEIRQKYNEILLKYGKEKLYTILQEKDPESCKNIHMNDTKRVIRALEIYDITGKAKTNLNKPELKPKYKAITIALNMPREILYERINLRVEKMFEEGLVEEINNLIKNGVTFKMQSMQAIGYKEFYDYFNNNCELNIVKELIAKNSRNYAKRQITFIKGLKDVVWFNPLTEEDKIIDYIKSKI